MDALVAHLANHGVKARVEGWTDTGDIDAVSALFACLDRDDIDLIVAGAYGHSRWVEGLFGGVSQDLIRQERWRCCFRTSPSSAESAVLLVRETVSLRHASK